MAICATILKKTAGYTLCAEDGLESEYGDEFKIS